MEEFTKVYNEFVEDVTKTFKRIKIGAFEEGVDVHNFYRNGTFKHMLQISLRDYEYLEKLDDSVLIFPKVPMNQLVNLDSITFMKNKKIIWNYFELLYMLSTSILKHETNEEHQQIISNLVKL